MRFPLQTKNTGKAYTATGLGMAFYFIVLFEEKPHFPLYFAYIIGLGLLKI